MCEILVLQDVDTGEVHGCTELWCRRIRPRSWQWRCVSQFFLSTQGFVDALEYITIDSHVPPDLPWNPRPGIQSNAKRSLPRRCYTRYEDGVSRTSGHMLRTPLLEDHLLLRRNQATFLLAFAEAVVNCAGYIPQIHIRVTCFF